MSYAKTSKKSEIYGDTIHVNESDTNSEQLSGNYLLVTNNLTSTC